MRVRKTHRRDRSEIHALVSRARHTSPALWNWEAHLTDGGFAVVEEGGRIEGALLASSDASPSAWVRLAAVGDTLDVGEWLDGSLPLVLTHLRALGRNELTWMDHERWAGPFLRPRGFAPLTDVITLTKTDHSMPVTRDPRIRLRPASPADFGAICAIDRSAFTPTWWRSEASVKRRAKTTSRFTVAECRGRVVGYAERELHFPTAHLNRLAVHPRDQRQGIGALLLKRALVLLWEKGVDAVSLNTQQSNHQSRRLYDRFGFRPTGDSATVWVMRL